MGRKRVHTSDADRAAAFRKRQGRRQAEAEAALYLMERPTVDVVRFVCRKLAMRAEDPAAIAAAVAQYMLEGLEQGAGRNCADAARNFVRNETPDR